MLKRKFRLRQDKDFRRVKRVGSREKSPLFWLNWASNDLPYSRFGFVASKKVGSAVQRNRAVRLLREVVRLNLERIKEGYDVVFVLKSSMVGKLFREVEQEVKKVLVRVKLFKEMPESQ